MISRAGGRGRAAAGRRRADGRSEPQRQRPEPLAGLELPVAGGLADEAVPLVHPVRGDHRRAGVDRQAAPFRRREPGRRPRPRAPGRRRGPAPTAGPRASASRPRRRVRSRRTDCPGPGTYETVPRIAPVPSSTATRIGQLRRPAGDVADLVDVVLELRIADRPVGGLDDVGDGLEFGRRGLADRERGRASRRRCLAVELPAERLGVGDRQAAGEVAADVGGRAAVDERRGRRAAAPRTPTGPPTGRGRRSAG